MLTSYKSALLAIACVAGAACRAASVPAGTAPPGLPLRVMSFNIRYDNPADGINAWPNRKDWVAGLVRYHAPDVMGVQEALAPMLVELDARLPTFARVGVGRTDGKERGEFSPIYYRIDRLELQEWGTFWLSPTPEVIGSRGWDAAIERIATWARVRDRRTSCRLLLLNTHFDHMGERAREESARLIRRRLDSLAGGDPVVITGDLNAVPSSSAYRVFTRDTIGGRLPLRDAFSVTLSPHYGPTSTWTAFRAIEPDRRIDYVMVSQNVTVESHAIISDSWDGRFPSDHLPVIATLSPRCA